MRNMLKFCNIVVLLCLVLTGCASYEIIPEASLAPLCASGNPGVCYDIGNAYKNATYFNKALVYFRQGCYMWASVKDLEYGDKENSPLQQSETCCLFAGYTSQLLDDYSTMLAYDSFGCNNFKTSTRESACYGAEIAALLVDGDNQLNSTIANGIMGVGTTAKQSMQHVDAAR